MSSIISDPLPKRSDNRGMKVRKTSEDLDETENSLVTTTGTVVKEGNTDMGKEPNVVKVSITPPIEKIILTQSTKHRIHKHQIKN